MLARTTLVAMGGAAEGGWGEAEAEGGWGAAEAEGGRGAAEAAVRVAGWAGGAREQHWRWRER